MRQTENIKIYLQSSKEKENCITTLKASGNSRPPVKGKK